MKVTATGIFILVLLLACSEQPSAPEPLDTYRGQWLVINYWASWCKPCITEVPELNKLDAEHNNITVLGVNYDGATGEELKSQESRLNIRFPTIPAPHNELALPAPQVLPTSFIVNPEGQITDILIGPQSAHELLLRIQSASL